MGASAGRVLLIPKGNWNSTDTYNCLDWVRHNRAAWVCKKACINSEPSETNTEYWQLLAEDPESVADMVGATESQNGTHGLVPAPQIGDEKKALLGDGTWGTVDAIYSFKTEEEYNQAVENDEIPDGAKVIKEYDEDFSPIDIDDAMSDTSNNPVKNKVSKKYIDDVKALRASTDSYGMTKVTNASDVTDSTGIALAGTEKNASIDGTLANQVSVLNSNLGQLSNSNLLINPDFKINQRGGKIALKGTEVYEDAACTNKYSFVINEDVVKVDMVSSGNYAFTTNSTYYVKASDVVDGYCKDGDYTIDRWRKHINGYTKVVGNGVEISTDLYQYLEYPERYLGKTVTLTAKVDGVEKSGTVTLPNDFSETIVIALYLEFDNANAVISIENSTSRKIQGCNILVKSSEVPVTVEYAKLELGSVATPFVPPDPATELVKCQRYGELGVQFIGTNRTDSFGLINGINFKVPKRIAPTVTLRDSYNNKDGYVYCSGDAKNYKAHASSVNNDGFMVYFDETGYTADAQMIVQYFADAEIY